MKKYLMTVIAVALALAMLAGCDDAQTELPDGTNPTGTTAPSTQAPPTETEGDPEYEGDASSYYIDVVYAQQIRRYHTALSQQWDADAYLDNELCPLAVHYYDDNTLDNIGFTFMDLDGDGIWELIIGAIRNAEQDPLVFEIWALQDGEPVMLAQSNAHNRYYLQYAQEDDMWSVAYESENGAANYATYYLQLQSGRFQVIQGVVFDAAADEKNPWFMTYDLDGDVSNDTPIDEETATSVLAAGRKIYAAQEYFPYCLYR